MFSKACEYAIKATIYIEDKSLNGETTSVKTIATEIGTPLAFTAKIIQLLTRDNLIESVMGAKGGYQISPSKLKTLNLAEIVEAVDGSDLLHTCALGLNNCNDLKPCPMHHKYKKVRQELTSMLRETKIEDLVKELKDKGAVMIN